MLCLHCNLVAKKRRCPDARFIPNPSAAKPAPRTPVIRVTLHFFRIGFPRNRSHVEELTKIWPDFSVQNLINHLPYKNESDLDHLKNGLRKAGLLA